MFVIYVNINERKRVTLHLLVLFHTNNYVTQIFEIQVKVHTCIHTSILLRATEKYKSSYTLDGKIPVTRILSSISQ